MTQKRFQYLSNSVLDLLKIIKSKKFYLLIILIIQLISISLFSYIVIVASITTAEDLQNLTGPLENLNLEDPNISEQEILLQGAKMFAAYETLTKHIMYYILLAMLVFFTVPGFLWSLSHLAVEDLRKDKGQKHYKSKLLALKNSIKYLSLRFLNHYKTYLILTSVIFLPFALITYLVAKLMLKSDLVAFSNAAQIFTGIGVILCILSLVALSVSKDSSWSLHLKKIKILLSKKLWKFLLTIIFVAVPISISTYFLYYSTLIKETFSLMLVAALLLLLSIIFSRIFLIISSKHLLVEGELE